MEGLLLLQTLTVAGRPMGSRQLARELGLDATRVNRLAKTLAGLGFLQQDAERKYLIGSGVHVLAAQGLHASGLLRSALTELEALQSFGLTVSLGVVWRAQVSYVYHWHPGMSSVEAVGMSDVFPAAVSGLGHALLAHVPEAHLPVLHPGLPASCMPAIRTARRRGWAYLCRSRKPLNAVLSLGVGPKPYAAIALSGAIDARRRDALLPVLRASADAIARRQRLYHASMDDAQAADEQPEAEADRRE